MKAAKPGVPVIVFPKGAGARLDRIVEKTGCDAVGLDWAADPAFVRAKIQPKVAVQGNLDPIALLAGGQALDEAVDRVLQSYAGGRHIFNLGHGILPATPIGHVQRMIDRVRSYKA